MPKHTLCFLLLFTTSAVAQRQLPFTKFKVNYDSSTTVPKQVFDAMVDSCVSWLSTIPLKKLTNSQHRQIMMCYNTVIFADSLDNSSYTAFGSILKEVDYLQNITKVYPDFSLNSGMGYYFPAINMEMGGMPRPYAIYKLKR